MGHVLAWDQALGAEIIEREKPALGATLPILHALQATFGYIHRDAIAMVASALNLSRAEIHGIVSFYHDFRHEPPGRHVIKLCRAEACQAVGARALQAHAERRLGQVLGGTSADQRLTIEACYCLGNCALGPAVLIDGALHGRVDPARFDLLLDGLL